MNDRGTLAEARGYLLAKAAERGAKLEVFAQRGTSTSAKAYGGEVDEFKLADKVGLGLRALVGGSWGYAYTENLSERALERALASALENAELTQPEAHAVLGAWPEGPHIGDLYGEGLSGVSVDRKVGVALELERAAREADPRVRTVPYAVYQDGDSEVAVANSEGLDRAYRANYAVHYLAPLVSENGQNKMKSDWQFSREFEQLDPTRTALSAVERSTALLGGRSAPSGHYRAVIERECMADFVATFAGMFSAKMVQEGKSPLEGRLGEAIGSPLVTLVDDATLKGGMASRPFDAEGYPSSRLVLIEAGALKAFMHNTETAAKDGVASTGHAARGSYKSTVGMAPSNLFMEPGEGDLDALLASLGDGLLLTGVQGQHAGANPVTGDFSLQAEGFWIEEGKRAHPLEVFTVAGNILELLSSVEAVAGDLKFSLGGSGAPSVRVKELAIGGK
jgi:PmbA protein